MSNVGGFTRGPNPSMFAPMVSAHGTTATTVMNPGGGLTNLPVSTMNNAMSSGPCNQGTNVMSNVGIQPSVLAMNQPHVGPALPGMFAGVEQVNQGQIPNEFATPNVTLATVVVDTNPNFTSNMEVTPASAGQPNFANNSYDNFYNPNMVNPNHLGLAKHVSVNNTTVVHHSNASGEPNDQNDGSGGTPDDEFEDDGDLDAALSSALSVASSNY